MGLSDLLAAALSGDRPRKGDDAEHLEPERREPEPYQHRERHDCEQLGVRIEQAMLARLRSR